MAKTFNTNGREKFNSKKAAPARRVVHLDNPIDCFDLRGIVESAARLGVQEIEFRAIYADYREPDFDAVAASECVRLCDFLTATYLITQYGYRLRMETTDAYLSFGRKAVTLEFVKEDKHDLYPESGRSN